MGTVRKIPVVGSYAVLQTMARHPRARPPEKKASSSEPSPETPPFPRKAGTTLTHTVKPTRYELRCYHCSGAFHVVGQHRFTLCPRCRQRVDVVHYSLDGAFDQTIHTAGDVVLKPGASIVSGASIKATTIRIEGRAEAGHLDCMRLELVESGQLLGDIDAHFQDLVVEAGVQTTFDAPVSCRHLTVSGQLRARVRAEGCAHIRAEGSFRGELTAARLRVEEGGGLCAVLDIQSDRPEEPA